MQVRIENGDVEKAAMRNMRHSRSVININEGFWSWEGKMKFVFLGLIFPGMFKNLPRTPNFYIVIYHPTIQRQPA